MRLTIIQNFLLNHSLLRCDVNFPGNRRPTYFNESLSHCTVIDYFVCDAIDDILEYCVLHPDINLSDHLHVLVAVQCKCKCSVDLFTIEATEKPKVKQLRWDHADLLSYYNTTMNLQYPLYHEIMEFEEYLSRSGKIERQNFIDNYYSKLVDYS